LLTVDLEDYRRQELARLLATSFPPNPDEVARQLDLLLQAFEACGAHATFFTVGRLTAELPASAWRRIGPGHRIGCHGHQHLHVSGLGARAFRADLEAAKRALEQTLGRPVLSFRAPYFSSDGCDPWFGAELARAGFRLDSSRRTFARPAGFRGTLPLAGSDGAVTEVPLPSVGFGPKRLTVIGGTYFRLLPLPVIRRLLGRAERLGFVPLVYLHPYDIDPAAAALDFPARHLRERAGDRMRRTGRGTVAGKLHALAATYAFEPIECLLGEAAGH
jgi:peptidoglycan/xylan/chitin deacetylase (PgdA/CDA1 family)